MQDSKVLCAFADDNTLIAVASDGNYFVAALPSGRGGECTAKEVRSLLS